VKAPTLSAPQPLADHHQFTDFDGGGLSLDSWLKRRAAKNQSNGSSRTHVVCEGPAQDRVIGTCCRAAGAIGYAQASSTMKRNQPDPVPVLVFGRRAIHKDHHHKGIGTALLNDAIRRAIQAADIAGVAARPGARHLGTGPAPLPLARLHRVARQAHDPVPDAGHRRPGAARAVATRPVNQPRPGALVARSVLGVTTVPGGGTTTDAFPAIGAGGRGWP